MGHSPSAASENFEKAITPKYEDEEKPKRWLSRLTIARICFVAGGLCVVIALFYGIGLPKIIDKKVKDGVVVCSNGDAAKEKFLDMYGDCDDCTPYYYRLHMFNATNAEDHLTNGAKLQLQEIGPYAYRRRQIRLNVTFNDDHSQITYKQYTYHTYDPSESCESCSETDLITAFDSSYFRVMAAVGGETRYLMRLAKGTFAADWNTSEILSSIAQNGEQMMRWVNGMNSMNPRALKTVSENSRVLSFLLSGPAVIADLDLSGFEYNGVFQTMPAQNWALGRPSLLAGLSVGSNYVSVCEKGGLNQQCASCSGDECLAIWAQCKLCTQGAVVMQNNNATCGQLQQLYAATYGEAEAASFVAGTCSLCQSVGLCAAPVAGSAETSGMDFSKTAPPANMALTHSQRTGCDDDTEIGQYLEYDGYTQTALWAALDSRRNPTLEELIAFTSYGNCANPTANLTCSPVRGNDGTSTKPGGAGMTGFKSDLDQPTYDAYNMRSRTNFTLYNADEKLKYKGISLHRFLAPETTLNLSSWNENLGHGNPVNGVASMSYTVGFLAYVSYALYFYGDDSLLQGVDITLRDGSKAISGNLYENGQLKDYYADTYRTFLDVEAGTGKTMRAAKRLQASYAMAKSASNATASMSDVVWPNAPTEVITPVYWGEEGATITQKKVDSYRTIQRILKASIPVLIIGLLLGFGLIAFGFKTHRSLKMATEKGVNA